MFILILVNAIFGAEFSCQEQLQSTCEINPQCAWTTKGCAIKKKACIHQSQLACLNSVDCSWDTCVQQCNPSDLVTHECSIKDNFCRIKIDGKLMSKEMCTLTEGCSWDMCYSSCNQDFLIPEKCRESSDTCDALDVGSCFAKKGCGWDKCATECRNSTIIEDDCLARLGVGTMPMTPVMPGMRPRMTPGMPVMAGMAGYMPGNGRMPMLKFDPATGRTYKPYQRRPLMLDRRVWTWLLALPFVCIIVFCLGYHFPSCDSGDNGGDIICEGEDMMSPPRGRSHSNFHSGAQFSLIHQNDDYTTSTIHTMQSSKPASQIRYRGPSKSNLFQQTMETGREDESVERERAFDPKRDPRMNNIPESDTDINEYMPPMRHGR